MSLEDGASGVDEIDAIEDPSPQLSLGLPDPCYDHVDCAADPSICACRHCLREMDDALDRQDRWDNSAKKDAERVKPLDVELWRRRLATWKRIAGKLRPRLAR